MVSKAEIRPPIKLEHGEYNMAANNYMNPNRYLANPIKMRCGYIDNNKTFLPTPSYSFVGDITPAIEGGLEYERSYFIAQWFSEVVDGVTTMHDAYLIFTKNLGPTGPRYASIVRTDGVWELTQLEVGDVFGPPHTTPVRKEFIKTTSESATTDPNQGIYPWFSGGSQLNSLVKVNGVWGVYPVKAYVENPGAVIKDIIYPKSTLIFQNRLYIISQGPGLTTQAESVPPKQRILASYDGTGNYFKVVATTPELTVKSAFEYEVFLEAGENMQTLIPSGNAIAIGTNFYIRVLKSGDTETTAITGISAVSYKVTAATCNNVEGQEFYGMIFMPTTSGLMHRLNSTIEGPNQETNESLVLRVRDDTRIIKRLSIDPELHLLIGLLDDNSLFAFSPPVVAEQTGGLIVPSTSYITPLLGDIIDVFNRGHIVLRTMIDNQLKYHIYQKDNKSLPPLTFHSFDYVKRSGAWRLKVESVDLTENSIMFAPDLKLATVLGLGIIYENQFFVVQKTTAYPEETVFLASAPLSNVAGIENIASLPVDVIPSGHVSNFTEIEAESHIFGFYDSPVGGTPTTFTSEGENKNIVFSGVDTTIVHPAYRFYAGAIFSRLECTIEWVVPEATSSTSTYKMTTSKELSDWIDVNPSNGYESYVYHNIYNCARTSADRNDIMAINLTPKTKYDLGNHRTIKITVIQ